MSTVRALGGNAVEFSQPARRDVVKRVLRAAVLAYQSITVARTPSCRYMPSCSDYALEALERFGALRGGALALQRLLRCRPGAGFGPDPVPEPEETTANPTRLCRVRRPT